VFGWETFGGKPLRNDIKKAPSLRSSYQKVGGHSRTWKEIRVRLIVPIAKSRIYQRRVTLPFQMETIYEDDD
jgi:hypothetical protein